MNLMRMARHMKSSRPRGKRIGAAFERFACLRIADLFPDTKKKLNEAIGMVREERWYRTHSNLARNNTLFLKLHNMCHIAKQREEE